MKQTLLIISFSDISKDARVLKQVRALSKDYDVTTCGFGPEAIPGVKHIAIGLVPPAPLAGIAAHIVPRFDRLMSRMKVFVWTYWSIPHVREARRLLKNQRFDVALANDVDTVALALRAAGDAGVHVDLHEYFPGIHDDSTELDRRQTAYYVWLIRKYARRAASATTVSREIADEYRKFGLDCDVVTNATPRMQLSPTPVSKPIRIVHSGIAQVSRQLELSMRAVAESSADVVFDLYLMPNDVSYLTQLRNLADELGGRVRVMEPLAQGDLVRTLNDYDVGLFVLPPTSFNTANALPNKFFDYVQARLGVLIGPSSAMGALLNEYGFGAITKDFSIDVVRETIDLLTPERVAAWKANADKAADVLSADRQIEVWERAIARLATRVS